MSILDMPAPTPEQRAQIDAEHAAYLASVSEWLRDKDATAAAVEAGKVIDIAAWKREHPPTPNGS